MHNLDCSMGLRDENISIFSGWIQEISRSIGHELSVDENGYCVFQIDESIIGIEISEDGTMLHLYSPLMELPQDDKELSTWLLIKALELNAFQVQTRGGALAVIPGGGPLIFCFSSQFEEMDINKFNQVLGEFYETIPILLNLLSEAPLGDP